MNSSLKPSGNMLPVSGRIPEDLYLWLSSTPMNDATTVSDKLRVAVATLKRLHDGDADYNGALAMHRDLAGSVRRQLAQIEPEHGHSEVLATIMEHAPALSAGITSAQVGHLADARKLEDMLTQRAVQLAESLLRQAVTSKARAYDEKVVLKHAQSLIELALLIRKNSTHITQGEHDD
jgi:hypothetical protein